MSAPPPAAPRHATRLAFLAAGFGMAGWAPLVPFAKARTGIDDATLGLLLLGMGLGSVAVMPVTGAVSARSGSRPGILLGGLGVAVVLPSLAAAASTPILGGLLVLFGAALGALNVAMNVHAVEVERVGRRPLMSGFHAHFSIGAFAGSSLMTALLSWGWRPLGSSLACAAVVASAIGAAGRFLLPGGGAKGGPLFVWPRGTVLLLAAGAAVTFLVEGAMRDWSALLIVGRHLVPPSRGGLGYIVFSVAMTAGRLAGDAVTRRLGDRPVLFGGCVAAVAGLAGLAATGAPWLVLTASLLVGLGASNIVPILYRRVGAGSDMPPGPAVAALTTIGHGVIILGPAVIGLAANVLGLPVAFLLLALAMAAVPAIVGHARLWTDGR